MTRRQQSVGSKTKDSNFVNIAGYSNKHIFNNCRLTLMRYEKIINEEEADSDK